MTDHNMEVYVWPGDWGLASIDINSLQIMAFSKFSAAPLLFSSYSKPWPFFKVSTIPCFVHGPNIVIKDVNQMMEHLKSQNYNCDLELTTFQKSNIKAYSHFLEEKLYPALVHTWWVDEKNYIELTRPWYAKVLPIPLNYTNPGHWQRSSFSYLHDLHGVEPLKDKSSKDDTLRTIVMEDAKTCLDSLSKKLGDNEFIFGNSPCSLDAMIYAYLAPLLMAPFPNQALQNLLTAHDNLVNYVKRINQKYFGQALKEHRRTADSTAVSQEEDFPNKWRNVVLSSAFAMLAMFGYSLSSGIIERNGRFFKLGQRF